jgi:hypothetical protein
MPGPRLRHPIRGNTAFGPERLPSYRRATRARGSRSRCRSLSFVETRQSARTPYSSVAFRRPASTLRSVCFGLDPAARTLRCARTRGQRRVSVDVLQSTLSKIEYPLITRLPVSYRDLSLGTPRRALRFTALGPLLLGHRVAARVFSSLEGRFASFHPSCCGAWRSSISVLVGHRRTHPTPAAFATTCRLGPSTEGRDHRRARKRLAAPNGRSSTCIDEHPLGSSRISRFRHRDPGRDALFAQQQFPAAWLGSRPRRRRFRTPPTIL